MLCSISDARRLAQFAIIFIFVVLMPIATRAQPYPMPYATVTRTGTAPLSRADTTSPYTYIGAPTFNGGPNEVSIGGGAYPFMAGFYSEPLALRAATVLNEMAAASNRCDKAAYDAWQKKWEHLIAVAYASSQKAAAVAKAASDAYQAARAAYNANGGSKAATALSEAYNEDRAAGERAAWAVFDESLLRRIIVPEYRNCGQTPPRVGMIPGSTIKLGGELAWGGSRNGFEDYNFNGSGIVGGVSGQVDFPIGANTYAGLGASVLGSGISGSTPDPITSNIQWLVPIDGVLGATFRPGGSQWPVSLYGFGGLAIGGVNISAPPFSATQIMTGWSAGVGADFQLSPTWSVGLKYRHFDLGNANFSVFPGGTSLVTERGDMVTGTLSYRFPIWQPAPIAPIVTK